MEKVLYIYPPLSLPLPTFRADVVDGVESCGDGIHA